MHTYTYIQIPTYKYIHMHKDIHIHIHKRTCIHTCINIGKGGGHTLELSTGCCLEQVSRVWYDDDRPQRCTGALCSSTVT